MGSIPGCEGYFHFYPARYTSRRAGVERESFSRATPESSSHTVGRRGTDRGSRRPSSSRRSLGRGRALEQALERPARPPVFNGGAARLVVFLPVFVGVGA